MASKIEYVNNSDGYVEHCDFISEFDSYISLAPEFVCDDEYDFGDELGDDEDLSDLDQYNVDPDEYDLYV